MRGFVGLAHQADHPLPEFDLSGIRFPLSGIARFPLLSRAMPSRSTRPTDDRAIPVVRLVELPALASELAAQVHTSGFAPDAIVYIETGARLLAHELQKIFRVPALPIVVKRGGHGVKKLLAPVAAKLPASLRDWLRRIEERSGVQRLTRRDAILPSGTNEVRGRVLLVDDASDTGRSLAVARELLQANGIAPADLRTAVLAATTERGRVGVNFFVFNRNCRMPWSSDSEELAEARARMERISFSDAARRL